MVSYCSLICKSFRCEINNCIINFQPLEYEIFEQLLEMRYKMRLILLYIHEKNANNADYFVMQNDKIIILCKLVIFYSKKYNETVRANVLQELKETVDKLEAYEADFCEKCNALFEAITKRI